jgi:intraflagellar transport protein 56
LDPRLSYDNVPFLLTQSYFFNVDAFNFNFAQAKASTGSYQEAEEIFLLINSEKYKSDYVYISWLARCCKLGRGKEGGRLGR